MYTYIHKGLYFERDCTVFVGTMSSMFEQKSTFRYAIIRIPSVNIWLVFTQHSVNICLIAVYCLNIFSIPKAASILFSFFCFFFLFHSFTHIYTHTYSNRRKKIREIDELAKRKYRAESARVEVFNLTRANSLNLHMPSSEKRGVHRILNNAYRCTKGNWTWNYYPVLSIIQNPTSVNK